MSLTLGHFLTLGAILFALSVIGIFLNRRNLIVLLMAIELMLLAVNMNFVAFSYYLGDMHGQVFVFFILTVAAAESAIGLAILVVVVLMYFGIININQTRPGVVQAPQFHADVAKVTVGTENKTVSVPTISVQKPAPAPSPAPAQ